MSLLSLFWLLVLLLQSQAPAIHYPVWFWEMPTARNTPFAVGYARRYHRIDSSFVYARRNSIWQLARTQGVTIESSLELCNQFSQNRLVGFQESETFDSTLALRIRQNYQILDSAVVGNLVLVLAAFGGSNDAPPGDLQLPPVARPDWIDVIPQADTVLYAVGTAPLYYYEQHSWERAEANARIQLAFQIETETRSINKKENHALQIWSENRVSVTLKNVTVARRWLDCTNRQCYVLCQMPVASNRVSGGENPR